MYFDAMQTVVHKGQNALVENVKMKDGKPYYLLRLLDHVETDGEGLLIEYFGDQCDAAFGDELVAAVQD